MKKNEELGVQRVFFHGDETITGGTETSLFVNKQIMVRDFKRGVFHQCRITISPTYP